MAFEGLWEVFTMGFVEGAGRGCRKAQGFQDLTLRLSGKELWTLPHEAVCICCCFMFLVKAYATC